MVAGIRPSLSDGNRCCLKWPGASGGGTVETERGKIPKGESDTARAAVIHRANLSPFVVSRPTDKSFPRDPRRNIFSVPFVKGERESLSKRTARNIASRRFEFRMERICVIKKYTVG